MIYTLPDVVTHTYHPAGGPFRNVCDLPPADAEAVIAAIRAETGSRRKPDYLARRWRTEAWLISERARKLGTTPLSRPIYFFLGRMADGWDRARPASIVVPLDAFDIDVLTFTYPDSMSSCPHLHDDEGGHTPHHGHVYTLSEIRDVVRRFGVPDPEVPRPLRGRDAFIEVQVWDDGPLARYRGVS